MPYKKVSIPQHPASSTTITIKPNLPECDDVKPKIIEPVSPKQMEYLLACLRDIDVNFSWIAVSSVIIAICQFVQCIK